MIDYNDFISHKKSLLIAPAGYGKTYTIAECLKHTPEDETKLILTHTHAGIAAIKEKIKNNNIPNSKYHVETITGFAQKYVLAFYNGNHIPDQENAKEYYPFIIKEATKLFKIKSIQRIVLQTYKGLFVDEYQDCSLSQHDLIIVLSSLFNTHILGDYMQGIFDFKESIVNLQDSNIFSEFKKYELETPWRWIKGGNENLGSDLKKIRKDLESNQTLDLDLYSSIETHTLEIDLFKPEKEYYETIESLLNEQSLLIIHPDTANIHLRIKVIQTFNNRLSLIESIDDDAFYDLSKYVDNNVEKVGSIDIRKLCLTNKLFNKTGIDNWFNEKGIMKKKTEEVDRRKTEPIIKLINALETPISFSNVSKILRKINKLGKVKCYRRELFNSFCKALDDADLHKTTVFEAMVNKRNSIRRMGRKVFGRCIGTTLLVKGLEFDTVVVLNLHEFKNPNHLYVALTRASKKLVVFTKNKKLHFPTQKGSDSSYKERSKKQVPNQVTMQTRLSLFD